MHYQATVITTGGTFYLDKVLTYTGKQDEAKNAYKSTLILARLLHRLIGGEIWKQSLE